MKKRFSFPDSLRSALSAALIASLVVAGCGGGTGGTGVTGSSAVSIGVMAKGSTIVNGVRFEDTTANITIDDTPKTNAALQNGMVVKLVGKVNDDGITGTAERIKALVEVRGFPTAVSAGTNPQSLVVNGQTVLVDDQTVYNNLPNRFNSITINMLIEVHGLRDKDGAIRATRIEADLTQMADSSRDQIRGVVVTSDTRANPTTFSVGGQPVNAL